MDSKAFGDLREKITRLKNERDQIMDEMRDDQRDLSTLAEEIRGLRYKVDFQNHELQKKETVIREYDTIISESSKAYDKLMMNTVNLKKAIEIENSELQRRLLKYKASH